MSRAARIAYWTAPGLFCLVLYWLGLKTWFRQDDFAWLALHLRLQETGDLWTILFAPMAQGTIRPLSERLFFLAFYHFFGLEAIPYRIAVFLTQFANLALLSLIARRLTGSRLAGFWAPVFWTANSGLALSMSWTAAYNQILCAFFILLSFYLLLRHFDTGERRYWLAQWVTFLLGFGALEINVVYPAIAAAYALCCARENFRKTLWLFVPSAAYAVLHRYAAPGPAGGLYTMYFDSSLATTLLTYWQWALGAARVGLANFDLPGWTAPAGTAILSVAILGFAVRQSARRNGLAAFFLLWFLIVLAPVLPLRDHVSDYYLTMPVIGLAMLGGWAFSRGLHSQWGLRVASVLCAAIYLGASVPVVRTAMRWNYESSRAARTLVRGVARARELHPHKVILLTGVDTDLFWAGVFDKPFRLIGVSDVYLAPGAEGNIDAHTELGNVADYVLPPGPALRALEENRAVVYSAGGARLRNVTATWRVIARSRWTSAQEPKRVDAGNPLFDGQLGPTWHAREGAYRWMPKRATVRLGGPSVSGERLYVSGYCPKRQLERGPLTLTVSVEGRALPAVKITRGDELFEFSFPLPAELIGRASVEIALEVDRTLTDAGDGRVLGLVFGSFAIR